MKASTYIVFFSIFSLALPSCGNRWYADDTNNITLTNFTKDLLSVYLNDSLVVNWKERYDEITLICSSDDEHYYLSLHLNESKIYKICPGIIAFYQAVKKDKFQDCTER